MNMRHDPSSGDRRPNEQVEFFVSPDGELQVTWGYTFDSEISGGIAWIKSSRNGQGGKITRGKINEAYRLIRALPR